MTTIDLCKDWWEERVKRVPRNSFSMHHRSESICCLWQSKLPWKDKHSTQNYTETVQTGWYKIISNKWMKPLHAWYLTMCYQAYYAILSVITIMVTTIYAVHMAVFTVTRISGTGAKALYILYYYKRLHVHWKFT
jgi:hypothetical protein